MAPLSVRQAWATAGAQTLLMLVGLMGSPAEGFVAPGANSLLGTVHPGRLQALSHFRARGLGHTGYQKRTPLLQRSNVRRVLGLSMKEPQKEQVSKELQEKINDKATAVTSSDEKKFDIGVSQFQQVPNSTWTGTTTLKQRQGDPEFGVWGQTWDAAAASKVRKDPLPWPLLILDRALDLVEDAIQGKEGVRTGRQGSGYYALNLNDDGSPKKHKIAVIGSGWASHSFIKSLDATKYDVTLVSPRNYFLFTPMLAGAATGTVELRSITESIREANPDVNYLEATVTEVMPKDKKISCQTVVCEGAECSINDFDLSYDTLVYAAGAGVNTFGIAGVKEHCYFLKQVGDASRLREAIGNTFERANLPDMNDDERTRTLTFVVVGAGPTGVELTAELKDFIEQDVPKFYPHLLPFIRIKVLEASDRVLMQFEQGLQNTAVKDLSRPGKSVAGLAEDYVQVMLKSSVKEVTSTDMTLNDGTVIPYGIAVWAAGIGPLPLTLDLIKGVEAQNDDPKARGRLICDKFLRVHGCPGIVALGDSSYIQDLPLPATAQVAAQQGAYLARLFNREYDLSEVIPTKRPDAAPETLAAVRFNDEKIAKPFQFLNLGILAYTGNSNALAQIEGPSSLKIEVAGLAGWLGWRSVYLAKQVSGRNIAMVAFDWAKTSLFGRDLSRF
eukprot:Tamp_03562.p1 GENE.Tamp_03562~~Tamp_03562.p1  ORF type:complete len:671 (-),score=112.12 Tamp_03562:1610-3622(-)